MQLLTGWRLQAAEARIRTRLLGLAWRHASSLGAGIRALRQMERLRRSFMGDGPVRKLVRVAGRTYWDLHTPGWPGASFDAYHLAELNRLTPFRPLRGELKAAIVAVTRKCPQRCAHCFEWDTLNQQDALTRNDLVGIVAELQARGVGQIQLSGGEPMQRLPDVLAVLEAAAPGTDFWLLTSGLGLTPERAQQLRRAGLTGVQISLDHYEPALHDFFRGFNGAFDWAERATRAAQEAGLVVGLSLCATQAFVTEENLTRYAQLARSWRVGFIQVLEPRAVGHYAGQEVDLPEAQVLLLEAFFRRLNHDRAWRDYPIVTYHGWHQRRVGCFGAGDRYLYVDTAGELHACPFCQAKVGTALGKDALETGIGRLRAAGCAHFRDASGA